MTRVDEASNVGRSGLGGLSVSESVRFLRPSDPPSVRVNTGTSSVSQLKSETYLDTSSAVIAAGAALSSLLKAVCMVSLCLRTRRLFQTDIKKTQIKQGFHTKPNGQHVNEGCVFYKPLQAHRRSPTAPPPK